MTTKININDHDALNAAFAERVAGWTWRTFPDGACPDIKHWRDQNGEVVSIYMDGRFTRSMDAVLPYLSGEQWCACTANSEWQTGFKGDAWCVWAGSHDEVFPDVMAHAPTLPHAAVVALLRAKGVAVEEDKP